MVQADCLKKVVVVCGATASGKSKLAVDIAETFGGEIVSADSIAVYRGLDIGSAKPDETERKKVPHHLIDVVDPKDDFSVAEYEEKALSAIEQIHAENKLPVICGGTGYFIDAILFKKSYGGCKKNEELRREFDMIFKTEGALALFEKLRAVDPETAEKLSPNDFLRVSRALEIFYVTGKKKSEIADEMKPRFSYIAFSINYPREVLYDRINERVDKMFERGLIGEVKGLLLKGVSASAQSMQGIGYKEVAEGLMTGQSEEEIAEIVKMNTRRYAKRQITYFKRMKNQYLLEPEFAFGQAKTILYNERFID